MSYLNTDQTECALTVAWTYVNFQAIPIVITVDDCSAFPSTTDLRTHISPQSCNVMCFATIYDGGVSQPAAEIVRLAGRTSSTTLNVIERTCGMTDHPTTWPIGSVVKIEEVSILLLGPGHSYAGYFYEHLGATSAAHADPGVGKLRLHGSNTPSLCTQLAINDGATFDIAWQLNDYDTVRRPGAKTTDKLVIKYVLIGPGLDAAPYLKWEATMTGFAVDRTGYWTIDIANVREHPSMADTSDGHLGYVVLDFVY